MMLDWNEYKGQINATIKEMSTVNPDVVKAYIVLSQANAKSKHLDAKTRELIALAVAVSLRCDGCINAHSEAAIKAGATKEEIMESLGVAITVNAGATLIYSARTIDAFNSKTQS